MATTLNYIKDQVELNMEINISSKSKDYNSTIGRWVYFKLARRLTECSLSHIGKLVNRDHSTVLYGLKKIDDEMFFNKELKKIYNEISILCDTTINYSKIEDIDKSIDKLKAEICRLLIIKEKRIKKTLTN